MRVWLVPGAGIEPALAFSANRILSPACLPVPPPGQGVLKKNHPLRDGSRAEDEIRTRDPHLGKVMLYQLSYFRICDKELNGVQK